MTSTRAPLVSVVVLNASGGARFIEACLDSIEAQTLADRETILVDNASGDGSLAKVLLRPRRREPFRVIRNEKNVGFAAGNNQAFQVARGRYLAILNNDAVAAPGWLAALVRVAESDPGIGICASQVRLASHPDHLDSAGMGLWFDGLAKQRGHGLEARGFQDGPREVPLASGCAALIRREVIERVGGFDESFFAYCEDTELGLRARAAGFSAVYVPDAVVTHRYSGTAGPYSMRKAFLVERNRLWTAAKLLPWPLLLAMPLCTSYRYAWHAFGALVGRGAAARLADETSAWRAAAAIVGAHFAALAGLPRALAERRSLARRGLLLGMGEVMRLIRAVPLRASEIALSE